MRRHIEQVHKNTPEGAMEQARKVQELSLQPFFQYLADNDLLPSEEMIKAREDERERRDAVKRKIILILMSILLNRKGLTIMTLPYLNQILA